MSVQFGKCNFDGKSVDPSNLDEVRPALAPYGPDGEGSICRGNIGILYRAFHTTKESRHETQPYTSKNGLVVTWDGRLDNREELFAQLSGELSSESTDLEIVAAAYQRWGTKAFAKLVGDWALSIWNPEDRSLILAKDFIGTRHLYYTVERDHVTWCTILKPLVVLGTTGLKLSEDYMAGWLSYFPPAHLTPYREIRAVPPSHFVLLQAGREQALKYWEFDSRQRIHHRSDQEYEEDFRSVFAESVRRRLRSITPVLAELSGGMDSSSVVCMADEVISSRQAEISKLDTLSYYDRNEPNWDEHSYFTRVQEKRGQPGICVDLSSQDFFRLDPDETDFFPEPSSALAALEQTDSLWEKLHPERYRVRLSGIGGDEFAGGVPDPAPQLADLLVTGQLREFLRQSASWALAMKRTWFYVALNTLSRFAPGTLSDQPRVQPVPWLTPGLMKRQAPALHGYPRRTHVRGALPSFQMSMTTLDYLRRQLACCTARCNPLYEERYPFLDRSMLEFLVSIPRSQIARPGCRRFLMRRAMNGIVPGEILARRRKASVSRAPLAAIAKHANSLCGLFRNGRASSLEIVDDEAVCTAIERASHGSQIPVVSLLRTVALELWLRQLPARVHVPVKDLSAEKSLQKGGELHDIQQA
jgi:asparagine synthase (glutamine-hydrolysing)